MRADWFDARDHDKKWEIRKRDKSLREELAKALIENEWDAAEAQAIANWDIYDQNGRADWFDSGWMFGERKRVFDIVIGNPPYIQLQKNRGELANKYRDEGYGTFARTGDVYVLFCERGMALTRPERGVLSYVTSNSWLRAKYGQGLRRQLSDSHTPLRLIELGKDVFENAIVDSSVLIARSGSGAGPFPALDVDRLKIDTVALDDLADEEWNEVRPGGDAPWSILSRPEWRVMEKMKERGTPLKDWDGIAIYRGILTGYNKAFLVDDSQRSRLIAEDSKSAEILKPILRGRDIQRYRADWAGLWLVSTLPSLAIDIDDYPAVKHHLLSYGRDRLEQSGRQLPDGRRARKKTPHRWFELQDTCAYHAEFAAPKLLWIELADRGRFAYDDTGTLAEATAFMLTGAPAKYLCGILNSQLVQWFLQHSAPTSGMGALRWKKAYLLHLPIPDADLDRRQRLISLVDRVLRAKGADSLVDTSDIETEIDQQVFRLFGLNAVEVGAITP